MNTTTPADGTYSYMHTPTYGPSWRVTVRVEGGRVASYMTGEGDSARYATPAQVEEMAPDLLEALRHELEVRGRVPGLMVPVAFIPLAQPIGKATACRLHRLIGRAGIPSGEHYGFASAALDVPVFSLAALYPVEARAVYRFLCASFPSAVA